MKCLNELKIRGQASRDDWCEVEPIYCCVFSRRISELASSLAADSRAANSQTSNLPPNPHVLTRHRSSAELRVVVIETSRTESLTEEPSPESSNLAMSRLRTRETIISPCVGLAPSLNVCTSTRKRRNCCTAVHSSTAVIAHGFWAHIGSIPWATSNRQTSQLALRRRASRTARNLLLRCRTASEPSTTAGLNP